MTLSKVKGVQASGSFENDFGTLQDNPDLPNHGKKFLYKFEYVFEDGIVMSANHKTNTSPFSEGSEVEYEVKKTHPEHGKSGTVKKPGTGFGGNNNALSAPRTGVAEDARQLMIVRQSSLNRAIEILIHNAPYDDRPSPLVDETDVIELAGRFTKWVMQPEKKEEKKVEEIVASANIGEENQPSASGEAESYLPF